MSKERFMLQWCDVPYMTDQRWSESFFDTCSC